MVCGLLGALAAAPAVVVAGAAPTEPLAAGLTFGPSRCPGFNRCVVGGVGPAAAEWALPLVTVAPAGGVKLNSEALGAARLIRPKLSCRAAAFWPLAKMATCR